MCIGGSECVPDDLLLFLLLLLFIGPVGQLLRLIPPQWPIRGVVPALEARRSTPAHQRTLLPTDG